MKFKLTVLLATFVVALGLLLGTSTAQTEPFVIVEGDTATGIQNLDVDGTPYNVAFLHAAATDIYGEDLIYDFPDIDIARIAKKAVNTALNLDNRATKVGPSSEEGVIDYGIGYPETLIAFLPTNVHNGSYSVTFGNMWVDTDTDFWLTDVDGIDLPFPQGARFEYIYADFTPAGPPPDPVTIGGSVTGLVGSGLVLQNNSKDDLTITENDVFTFAEPLTPGYLYEVTVFTQPEGQTCIVDENGRGTVPPEGVTDVIVTCAEAPDPVTIGGTVTGLVGSGLVLQNSGKDDLTIAADGEFTFAMLRTPGTFYDVTVLTNPTIPAQTCSVENGSGTVPLEAVTNVAVTCAEVVVSDVTKIAAVGDPVGDDVLTLIERAGGVAINIGGQVVFGGRGQDNVKAVFTQDGRVVAVLDTLPDPDETIVSSIHTSGEVAINNFGEVAFHGQAESGLNDIDAVFTQDGPVAKEGARLPDDNTQVHQIDSAGKVAINDLGVVAFLGKIQAGQGLFKEEFGAVFTSDEMLVKEGDTLPDPDSTIVGNINDNGGVALNLFGVVAFHGQIPGDSNTNAVFTSEKLIAAEDLALPDTTIVGSIDANGGVAINLWDHVAFIGQVWDPVAQADGVRAVFTQDEPVAQEGETLPDGTPLDEIEVSGGVAINLFGEVAFHGRTGGIKAVFTQNGLVAKVGDNLADGTTLNEIWPTGGVAINPYDRQVAFHGQVGSTGASADAVFVGLAPLPPVE